jgi:hypothetical protein
VPKTGPATDLDDYAPVAERIALFYQRFPVGRIITRLVEHSHHVVIVQASVYRSDTERYPSATGWAAERPGDGEINTVACLENTETSAIGRALANLGLGAIRPRSLDRMLAKDDSSVTLESLGVRTIYARPKIVYQPSAASIQGRQQPGLDVLDSSRKLSLVARDLIRLLDDAERYGMRPRRAARYRRRIESDRCSEAHLERLERALRNWLSVARERGTVEARRDDGPAT